MAAWHSIVNIDIFFLREKAAIHMSSPDVEVHMSNLRDPWWLRS
jgi:hypothetical protein